MQNDDNAREAILKKSVDVEGTVIRGYDFNNGVNYSKLIDSFKSTGFQAANVHRAIEIINEMRKNDATIFLGYTSNMISSGLREIFRYVVEHKHVDYIVTTGGGVEEDIIKCLGDCVVGEFRASGKALREKGINRIGNIYAPNNNYIAFEEFVMPILEEFLETQKKTGVVVTPHEIVWKLGEKINNPASVYYWAHKHKIPVFSPALLDGSFGDMVYFFRSKHPEFMVDIARETSELNNATTGLTKSGVIILGTGIVKHAILNAHLYRNGADYAVYVNTAQEYDGSDAGALPEEAVSWGKIRPDGQAVKVHADATIVFPLMVAETFAKE